MKPSLAKQQTKWNSRGAGFAGVRSCQLSLGDKTLRLGVVHGLANAAKLLEEIKAGRAQYDLVEVMACPGGCVGGAGSPLAGATAA